MAPLKTISYSQIDKLREHKAANGNFVSVIDGATQAAFFAFVPGYQERKATLVKLTAEGGKQLDDAAAEKAMDALASYANKLFSSKKDPALQFSKDEVQQLLSLTHRLQPETELTTRQVIEQSLAQLGLEPVLPPEKLAKQLPALIASLTREIQR